MRWNRETVCGRPAGPVFCVSSHCVHQPIALSPNQWTVVANYADTHRLKTGTKHNRLKNMGDAVASGWSFTRMFMRMLW